jgi:opacity protein-like surface antigen
LPQLGVAAAAALPAADYGPIGGWKVGWEGMALVAFRIGRLPLGVRLDGSYSVNMSNEPINGVTTAHKIQFLGWDADLTLTLPVSTRVKFYLLAGSGLYNITYTETQQYQSATFHNDREKLGYNLGYGFTVGALFFELRYVHADGFGVESSWQLVPVTAGLRFGSR